MASGLGKVPLCQAKVAIPPPHPTHVDIPVSHTPKMGFKQRRIIRKGGRGTKGVLPSATPPCHAFLPKAETKNEVVEAACPTTSAGPDTAWCALPVAPSPPPSLQLRPCHRSCADQTAALQVLEEYKGLGAVKEFLVPWFVIRKREGEGEKLRLISDCREINQHLQSRTFKLDHWQHIFPLLRKGIWACKTDLKHAFFIRASQRASNTSSE